MPRKLNHEKYEFKEGDKVVISRGDRKTDVYVGTVLEKVLIPNYPSKDSVYYNIAVNGRKQSVNIVDADYIMLYDTFIFEATMDMYDKINMIYAHSNR